MPTSVARLLGFLLALSACQSAPGPSAAPAPAAVQQAPVALAPPPAPAPRTYSASVATFRGDQLDECIDYVIVSAPGKEAEARDLASSFGTNLKGDEKPIRIAKPCAEQFPDRTVLATCSIVDRPGTAGTVTLRDRYYSVATVSDSDAYMKDCLTMRGDWQPNTNRWAVQHERVRGQMKQMQKIAQDLEAESR